MRFAVLALRVATLCVAVVAPLAAARPDKMASPIYGVTIPSGYRLWPLIAVSHEANLDELRAILGNPKSIAAYRSGKLPFPDGATVVKLAWKHQRLTGSPGAFVAGAPTTVQVMVKDSKRYNSTGGWGFGRFVAGKPVDEAQHRTCFSCHQAGAADHDFVFTRYAP